MLKLIKNLSNIPGWRSNRKIIVFESDDWGSIRMPSNETREKLERLNINLGKGKEVYRYNLFDTLASKSDLENLFYSLTKFKDIFGKHPRFTALSLVSNPDFDKIKSNNFEEYYYEPFTTTLSKYGYESSLILWKEGKDLGIFQPEFHGREHLNVPLWMRDLKNNHNEARICFEHNFWGFNNINSNGIKYQAAFALDKYEDLVIQKQILDDGLNLFEKIHGFKANFFVPPNGHVNNQLEEVCHKKDLKFISTSKIQNEELGGLKKRKRFNWIGKINSYNQIYLTRNCFFEPSDKTADWVDGCLSEIETAFKWKKPAVISTHRVNFVGGLSLENRDYGLRMLEKLISKILQKWPDVEFLSSTELGEVIKNKKIRN